MFNWWTFLFQILNFFLVVYILYRVLFKPLRRIIAKRKEEIQKTKTETDRALKEVENLKKQYEEKLTEISVLRKKTIEKARAEAQEEVKKILENAQEEAKKIKEKTEKALEDERKRLVEQIKTQGIEAAFSLSVKLLSSVVDEELHRKMLEKTLDKIVETLPELPEKQSLEVQISTARELKNLQSIASFLEKKSRMPVRVKVLLEPELVGGVRVFIEDYMIDGSILGSLERAKEKLIKGEGV